ncbi:hypothetical protein [Stenotrophomonas maltophilia]|uniref:hypothetical protein n=1 Tax=Stenotrophomonas maltophilia TaxID=40324 RepID=UPI00117FFD13|nr:hypothetical protein [Stenotrophomonas maltophilia]
MSESKIQPDRITKPIQLLAAWLAGLLLVNTAFLAAAGAISSPSWVRGALVIASIVNVPLFLVCLFLLQTKFRPQMQEDSYYSKYLESNTGMVIRGGKLQVAISHLKAEASEANQRYIEMFNQLRQEVAAISSAVAPSSEDAKDAIVSRAELLGTQISEASRSNLVVRLNDLVPSYTKIRTELIERDIPVGPNFGSTSEDPEVPELLTVGFGKAVPLASLRTVVQVAEANGFDRIHYADNDISANGIYVGSYIYKYPEEPRPVPIKDVLDIVCDSSSSLADLIARIAYLQARA